MAFFSKHNRKGFGFIVAIGMLGLLAFMGLFLMQSSSTEYSQTSISVYRTMGRQLAEAAADEACVLLEERFKDKTNFGYFDQFIEQAATSGPRSTNGPTGQNPFKTNDFNNLKDDLMQTSALIKYHVTRAGFVLEKVLPTIKDLRPIPQGPLDNRNCYYLPTDRTSKNYTEFYPFDTERSKDWYCSLQIEVTLSLAKQKTTKINYTVSRDVKLLNVGPIGRNYTFFSVLGPYIDVTQSEGMVTSYLHNRLNAQLSKEEGRLFLWNVPFQSRIYMHGPAVIKLENSNLVNYPNSFSDPTYIEKDAGKGSGGRGPGAFLNPSTDSDDECGPGLNMAYQYDDSFYGFSYYPDKSRGVFPGKTLWQKWFVTSDTKEDTTDLDVYYNKSGVTHATITKGGHYPKTSTSFFNKMQMFISAKVDEHFFVGEAEHQKFLPAGPFCRTPWRYVPEVPPSSGSYFKPNQKEPEPCDFPEEDNKIRIEHRWDPKEENNDFGEATKIYSLVTDIKYIPTLNIIDHSEKDQYTEFCVNYYNNPDPEGFWAKLKVGAAHMFKGIANLMTFNIRVLISAGDSIFRRISAFNKLGELGPEDEDQCINLFPTNFKYKYTNVVTRTFNSIEEIPLDEEKNWKIDGVYWMNAFTLERSVHYVGTGTFIITGNAKTGPLTFKGSLTAARDSNDNPRGHLTIFYYPAISNLKSKLTTDYKKTCEENMLILDGGVTLEASVFSLLGVRSVNGFNATMQDFINVGMNPRDTLAQWAEATNGNPLNALLGNDSTGHGNVIKGNYCNYYIPLDVQGDDLWVIHDNENNLMFKEEAGKYLLYQDYMDYDESYRKEYEKLAHEFFLSPKIQHIGITGAL